MTKILTTPKVSPEQVKAMYRAALSVKPNTFPEPNHYTAAVLTKAGNIYPGVVYKSDTRVLSMHCEATALTHAAIHGEHDIIAITGPNCHICKQLLWENAIRSGIDIQIVMADGQQVPISQQMPFPWPDIDGNK